MKLTDEQALRMDLALQKAMRGISGQLTTASYQAVADELDAIRQESVESDLVERCARQSYDCGPGHGYDISWDCLHQDTRDFYMSLARGVLAEAQLGQCSAGEGAFAPVTLDELDIARGAWDIAPGIQWKPAAGAAINAVLASRRQRMVMSGDQEKPASIAEALDQLGRLLDRDAAPGFNIGVHTQRHGTLYLRPDKEEKPKACSETWDHGHETISCCKEPGHFDHHCGQSVNGYFYNWQRDFEREGAKAAEHCQTEPEEQDAYQITAETYELWQPAQILPPKPKMTLPEVLRRVEHRRLERGPGLQAIALKELDRPLSSKPSHVASFGFDAYDEDP